MQIEGYQNFSLIGAGGNAHVYSARSSETDEFVAVKVLRGGGDEAVSRRFERERSSMAALEPLENVAPIQESGVTEAGDPYLVMPLFSGGSLGDRLKTGPLKWREALEMTHKVADAVSQAHGHRILHLDIKPANVLLDEHGEPFLADFGIAESMGSTASMSAQLLTPAYTPPERFDGSKPTELTDVYGLGGLMFALLSGRAPYVLGEGAAPASMISAILYDDVDTSELVGCCPEEAIDLVERTLAKSVDERPQSAGDLRDEIAQILEDDRHRAFDPIIPFRVSSEGEAASQVESLGQLEELSAIGGEPIGSGELIGEPALALVGDGSAAAATPQPVASASSSSPAKMWLSAAGFFVAVCITGVVTASVVNGAPSIDVSERASAALDEVSDAELAEADTSTDPALADVANPAQVSEDPVADAVQVQVLDVVAQPTAAESKGAAEEDPLVDGAVEPVVAGDAAGFTPVTDDQVDQAPDVEADATPATVEFFDPVTTTTAAPQTNTPAAPVLTTAVPATTTTTTTTTTTQAPRPTTSLEFEERIDIGDIGTDNVRFRFTSSATTSYVATVSSGSQVVKTHNGTATGGVLEGVTISGLTPGTDYTVEVTLTGGDTDSSSSAVSFRTSGGETPQQTDQVQLLNLRLVSTSSTRFEVNYDSNICANGSFVIRDLNGNVVGSNAGQPDGCTTRHLAVPGFWTPALTPNTTYVITLTVEANGQGLGAGNTATQSLTVTTAD